MKYNNIPKTSVKVSAISLGTMMFSNKTDEAESLRILDFAYENGINFWDTANTYNNGGSEKIVGKALKGRREDIVLATKVFGDMGGMNNKGLSRRNIMSAVDKSLMRLDTDYIDIYYMHAPDYETDIEESLDAMNQLVRNGKIRYVAVSNFASWQVAEIMGICEKRGYAKPVITQNVHNLLARSIEPELVPCIKHYNIGLAIYNPVAAGILAGKYTGREVISGSRFDNNKMYQDRYWNEINFNAVDSLIKMADDYGMSLMELAMRWVFSNDYVTSVISGVSRLEQLEENIKYVDLEPLSADLLAKCDELWEEISGNRHKYNR